MVTEILQLKDMALFPISCYPVTFCIVVDRGNDQSSQPKNETLVALTVELLPVSRTPRSVGIHVIVRWPYEHHFLKGGQVRFSYRVHSNPQRLFVDVKVKIKSVFSFLQASELTSISRGHIGGRDISTLISSRAHGHKTKERCGVVGSWVGW